MVTGGAGYIGSHACKALAALGHVPVSFDNYSTGWREAVKYGPAEEGDLRDGARLAEVLARHRPRAVLHFAALSDIAEAGRDPARYWDTNVVGTLRLLEAMAAAGTGQLVFSSTCAVYEAHDGRVLDETCPLGPLNAYGASKRAAEDLIRDTAAASGLRHVIFRYFNVAGADPSAEIGECHRPETHLVPRALAAAAGQGAGLRINGTDYPTPDGTCLRDYVHVCDVVAAHLLALDHLQRGGGPELFNLGSGHGHSVREVIAAVEAATGRSVPVEEGPRRPGDCAALVSGSARAAEALGWTPRHAALEDMIATARAWHEGPGYRR
ncbi:UDP-glucose 4-epimerase GalE [Mangrovicoccus algicola]|nr:UDP-glucose 4-epimerase GalE [Mangrovicoccus algicola]